MKTTIAAVLAVLALAGCGGVDAAPVAPPSPTVDAAAAREETCRQGTRTALGALAADKLTQDEAQAAVDKACLGVPAAARSAIVEAEQAAIIARYMASPTP